MIDAAAINQKRLEEDKRLNAEMSKYTSLQQQQEHEKKEVTFVQSLKITIQNLNF